MLKKYNFSEALSRLRRYCAYQERCHKEVKDKLYGWGFNSTDGGQIIAQLIEEDLLNEVRFATAIAGGKFRQKGWGRQKIIQALKAKNIPERIIQESLKEINADDYEKKLLSLLRKKLDSLNADPFPVKKQKLLRYAAGKGYETELIYEVIEKLLNEGNSEQ